MSYFVFGTATSRITRSNISENEVEHSLHAMATEAGLYIRFGKDVQPIVQEMLSACAPRSTLRFVLTNSAEQDTSEELISPCSDAAKGIRLIADWLQRVCANGVVESVALWISDGFDDRFIELSCTATSFQLALAQHLQLAHDVAPLRVTVACTPVRPTSDPS